MTAYVMFHVCAGDIGLRLCNSYSLDQSDCKYYKWGQLWSSVI